MTLSSEEAELRDILDGMLISEQPAPGVTGDLDSLQQWTRLRNGGYLHIGIPESVGGAGGGLGSAAEVWAAAARHGVPGPVVESWLAARATASVGRRIGHAETSIALSPMSSGMTGLVTPLDRVPWARAVREVVVVTADDRLVVVPVSPGHLHLGQNLAGEARDSWLVIPPPEEAEDLGRVSGLHDELRLWAALVRSVQLWAAADQAVTVTSRHIRERRQFGKRLANLLPVQQRYAEMIAELELLRTSVQRTLLLVASDGPVTHRFAIQAVKLNANAAARSIARSAHQLLGAMGTTAEYPLARFTTRLWSWAQEFGSTRGLVAGIEEILSGESLWKAMTTGE